MLSLMKISSECFMEEEKKESSYTLYAINNTELFLMPHQMQRKDEMTQTVRSRAHTESLGDSEVSCLTVWALAFQA